MSDNRLMELDEARIEMYKALIRADVIGRVTGDEDLSEEIAEIQAQLEERIND